MNKRQGASVVVGAGSTLARAALAVAMVITAQFAATPAWAQPAPQQGDTGPSAKGALVAELGNLDQAIAALAVQRAGMPAAQIPNLELRIDLRILARWSLEAAIASEDWTDAQAAHFLRSRVFLRAADWADAYAGPVSPAAASWHVGTFKMHAPKNVGEGDAQAKETAVALMTILRPGAGLDAKTMRPPVPPRLPVAGTDKDTPRQEKQAGPASVDALGQRVRGLSVSAELRRQLLGLVTATESAARGEDPKEAEALRATLQTAVELGEGLSGNLAVSPDVRAKLESELAMTVALISDPRLREGAGARLAALEPYARLLARVGAMKLTDDQVRRFAPTIAYARTAADGGTALNEIEEFLKVTAEFDAHFAADYKPVVYVKPAEATFKFFNLHREAFYRAAANPTSADQLKRQLEELRYHSDLLTFIERVPKVQDVLATLKTKPTGGLDRKLGQAIIAASVDDPTAERTTARKYLDDLKLLAEIVEGQRLPVGAAANGVPEAVWAQFAGTSADKLEAKRKQIIQEQANILAAGTSADRGKLVRLAKLPELVGLLNEAAKLQADLAAVDGSGKWIDLQLGPNVAGSLSGPVATGLQSCFAGFLNDQGAAFDAYPKQAVRLRALGRLADQMAVASKTSATYPTGELLLLQQLLTPLDKAPFAAERLLSLGAFVFATDLPDDLVAKAIKAMGK